MIVPPLAYGFIALTLLTVWLFYRITGGNHTLLLGFAAWLLLHAIVAATGFYGVTDTLPPRLALALVPTLIMGLLVGFGRWGSGLRAAAKLEHLHYFHGVRILVETVFLHELYEAGYLARVLTYEGQNLDVIAGLSGPLIGLLVFRLRKLPLGVAKAWNVAGIALLLWTISRAVLSAPSAYQRYGFDQPTLAIFQFPYIWLPALVAPLMLWAHFMALKKMTTLP